MKKMPEALAGLGRASGLPRRRPHIHTYTRVSILHTYLIAWKGVGGPTPATGWALFLSGASQLPSVLINFILMITLEGSQRGERMPWPGSVSTSRLQSSREPATARSQAL